MKVMKHWNILDDWGKKVCGNQHLRCFGCLFITVILTVRASFIFYLSSKRKSSVIIWLGGTAGVD